MNETWTNQYVVTGLAGTQIKYQNMQGVAETVNGVTGGINVNLPGAGGAQAFGLSNAEVFGSVNINLGRGESFIGIGEFPAAISPTGGTTVHGNLNINAGAGGAGTRSRHDRSAK